MGNLTKLKSLFILCLVICFLSSCGTTGDRYDKMEVVDRETGDVYILTHNIVDTYFVKQKTLTANVIDTMYCR